MKKLFTLALAFFLGLSSCTNDEVKLEPSFEEKLLANVKFDNEVSIANKEKKRRRESLAEKVFIIINLCAGG